MKSFHPTAELLGYVHGRARCRSWLLALIVMLVFGVVSGALAKGDKDSDAGKKLSPYEEQSKKQNDDKKDGDGKHCTSKNCDIKHHNHPKPPKPPKPPKGRNKVLAAPTLLTAQAVSLFQVNLTWADNSTNELGFKIERSSDGRNFTQIAQVLPNTTTYRDLNRFPDTEYFYRVCAFIARGNSAYSAIAREQTPAPECGLTIRVLDRSSQILPNEEKVAVAIAAGTSHGLALHADGTVTGWSNGFGNPVELPPTNLTSVVAIAAGGDHGLALRRNGTVVGWGVSKDGAEVTPSNLVGVVAISSGGHHSLALKSDGTVVGWGENSFGATSPPPNLVGVVAIAAGGQHSLALKSDGTVVGWGLNRDGQAAPPTNLKGVVAIAAGSYHSLALKEDGTVVVWGSSIGGTILPTEGLTGVSEIAAGAHVSYALKSNGVVVRWAGSRLGFVDTQIYDIDAKSLVAGGLQFISLIEWPNSPDTVEFRVNATNQVAISWFDNSFGRNSFTIERAPFSFEQLGGGDWATIGDVGQGTTNFNDTAVTTDASYRYRVSAYNTCHLGAPFHFSPVVTVAPPMFTPSLYVSAFADQSRLTVNANNTGVTAYQLERAPDVGGIPGAWSELLMADFPSLSHSIEHVDAHLPLNTTNWYRARVFNGLGASPYCEPVSVTIVPPRAPSYAYAYIAASNSVKLVWYISPPYDQDGFKIDRTTDLPSGSETWDEIASVSNNLNSSIYSDHFVITNVTYRYRIRGFNPLGVSLPSNEAVVSVIPPSGVLLAGWPFANSVKLLWGNDSNLSEIERFTLERANDVSGSPGTWTELATIANPNNDYSHQYTDQGLLPDTTYWYRVRLINWVGSSPYSEPRAITIVRPSVPEISLVSVGISNLVSLTWSAGQLLDQDGFRIERALDVGGDSGTWSEIGVVITTNRWSTTFNDAHATPHSVYWYRVRAFNGAGISDFSPQVSFTVSPPREPIIVPTQILDGVNLFFYGQDFGVKGFKLERAPDSSGAPGIWTQIAMFASSSDPFRNASGSITDSNLVPLATYWYRVRAFNWVGDSEYSQVATVTLLPSIITTIEPLALLTPLRITQLTPTNHDVLLTWTATGGTTNVVEAAAQPAGNFVPVSPNIILTGSGSVTTNYLDVGALTNSASRFYRIRVVP